MRRPIAGQVVVVTGASSGIGRATALLLASRGADVVVAARRRHELSQLADACEDAGARVLAVPADVTDADAMEALADAAVDAFGRLDAWVNNAGVFTCGSFTSTPPEIFERTLEINLLGYVNGARAALPYFRQQHRGVLVNIASRHARVPSPEASAYVASEYAVRGFSSSLREELRGTGIDVCTLFPPSVDTPLFEHAANFSGHVLSPVEPVISPARVARAIVACLERPRREVTLGAGGKLLVLLHRLAPGTTERLLSRTARRRHLTLEGAPETTGNLFAPMEPGSGVHGHRVAPRRRRRKALLATLAAMVPMAVAVRAVRGA